ncbi:hypothetical protein FF3_00652 [Fretibacterium fastidiosum]|uniref:Uncharacterized protein n=1 Tax=Fretibacterium fastidiosum TaxID=651822 RepID=A0AB94IW57_9BACT|nr:hypothetical protein SY1_05410 [Fretibacterium fastidiosum]
MRFSLLLQPLALALQAWIKLLIPSRMPLLIRDSNH